MRIEGFPTAETVKNSMGKLDYNCYGSWLKKAKKSIIIASKKNMSYCFFHLKYYDIHAYEYVYASLANKDFTILNPINNEAQGQAEMLVGLLKKLGYEVSPFVGERPFEMDRCNISTNIDEGEVFVGHGALGLYIKW